MIKKSLLALAPILAAVMPMTGMAAEGTVGFEGHITQTTCVVDKTFSENQVIDLGKYPTEWFPEVNNEGVAKEFSIYMEGCPNQILKPVFYGATVPSNPQLLQVSQAGNIGIAVYDSQYKPVAINVNNPNSNELDFGANIEGLVSVVTMWAVYRSYGVPVTPGRADATVTFSIEYP